MRNSNNTQHLLSFLDEIKRNRQDQLVTLKDAGNILVGYFCNYTPPEIVETCGAIPIRILDNITHQSETHGRKYIQRDSCSYCKAALGSLLSNSPFSCIISGTTCDQMRRLHEIISDQTQLPTFLFNNPRTYEKEAMKNLYKNEMLWIIEELTNLTHVTFSEELLRERTKKWNELRIFLSTIQDIRKQNMVSINGKTMFRLVEVAYFLGPDQFLSYKKEIETIINRSNQQGTNKPIRMLYVGSIVTSNEPLLFDLIEENNQAVIIADTSCTGIRWFHHLINEKGNMLDNMVHTYHEKTICPHRKPNEPLFGFMKDLIEKWHPDGIIYRTLKFCHPWTFEVQTFKNRFDIPLLHLDMDYSDSSIGQMRTRIQAFIEMIQTKRFKE